MADQHNQHESKIDESSAVVADRGLFDFMGKKEEEEKKCEGEAIATEFDEKVQVSEEKKLQRSNSSSSSSSDEEEIEEGGEKKKKKKEKKKKICGEDIDTNIPIENEKPEEKKGFIEKIKEKLPGGKKPEEVASPPPTPAADCAATPAVAAEKDKKGFLDKIKEKIPGYSKGDHEEKEKEGVCN